MPAPRSPSHDAPTGKRSAGRQYVFRARRDRQRIAHRLAVGMGVPEVAAVERCAPADIQRLLGDLSFRKLVQAYEELIEAPPEVQRAKLVALAALILREAVLAGDAKACAFVLHLDLSGKDPAATLAEAVQRALLKARQSRGPNRTERGALNGRPSAETREPSEIEAAEKALVAERAKVEQRLVQTADALRRRVINEAERLGTAWATGLLRTRPTAEELDPMASPANEAAAVARHLHRRTRDRDEARASLAERRCTFGSGRPAAEPPVGAPVEPDPPPRPEPAHAAAPPPWWREQVRPPGMRPLAQIFTPQAVDATAAAEPARRAGRQAPDTS